MQSRLWSTLSKKKKKKTLINFHNKTQIMHIPAGFRIKAEGAEGY